MSLNSVLLVGAAIRFVVPSLIPRVSEILASTVQISTPIDSFRSLQEAFFYLDHGLDVYDGGVVHHPPVLVAVLKLLRDLVPAQYAPLVFNLFFTVVDVGIAYKLVNLNKWYNAHQLKRTGRVMEGFSDALIAAFYMFNPLLVLTSWSHSSMPLTYFLIVELVHQVVVDKNDFRGAIALGVAAYLSYTPAFLIVPFVGLALAVAPKKDWSEQGVRNVAMFFATIMTLILVSFALTALIDFVRQCYWTIIVHERISPNMGLWWYIFTEMFDFFTPLYRGIFNLYSVIFVLPLTIRFYESEHRQGDSFLALVMCYLWLSFTKQYPIVGDLGFALSIFPIFKCTVLPHAKFLFITMLMLIVVLLLAPIFYYCWILLGNGNSNFFYSMDLIWGGVHILLFLDFVWGRMVFDYIQKHNVKDPLSLRLTQI